MHNVLEPRLPPVNDDPVCLLWSRCGSLDNRPNSWYVPNHFVPLTWNSEISCETAPLEVATDAVAFLQLIGNHMSVKALRLHVVQNKEVFYLL